MLVDRRRRAQTAIEYIMIVGAVILFAVLVVTFLRSGVIARSGEQINQSSADFFQTLQSIVAGVQSQSSASSIQCSLDEQCSTGYCSNSVCENKPCTLDSQCLSGLCSSNVCLPTPTPTANPTAECNLDSNCLDGLSCVESVVGQLGGVCATPSPIATSEPPAGEDSCLLDTDCDSTEFCLDYPSPQVGGYCEDRLVLTLFNDGIVFGSSSPVLTFSVSQPAAIDSAIVSSTPINVVNFVETSDNLFFTVDLAQAGVALENGEHLFSVAARSLANNYVATGSFSFEVATSINPTVCVLDEHCRIGQICGNGVCLTPVASPSSPPVGNGLPCVFDSDCESGLLCVQTSGLEIGVCAVAPLFIPTPIAPPVVDETAPEVSSVSPTEGNYYVNQIVSVSATANDFDSGVKKIHVFYIKDAQAPVEISGSPCLFNPAIAGTSRTCSKDFIPPSTGSYVIQAYAVDDAAATGNTEGDLTSELFTGASAFIVSPADVKKPIIAIPSELSGIKSGEPFEVSFAVNDDMVSDGDEAGQIASVSVSYVFTPQGGSPYAPQSLVCQNPPWALGGPEYYCTVRIQTAALGNYVFTANAVDVARPDAHTADQVIFSVPIVDSESPIVSFTATPSPLVGPGSASISVLAIDDIDVASLSIVYSYTPLGGSASTTTVSCPIDDHPSPSVGCGTEFTVADGLYEYYSTAVDNSIPSHSFTTSPILSFTADVSPPLIKDFLVTPLGEIHPSTDPVKLSATAQDYNGLKVSRVEIYFGPSGGALQQVRLCDNFGTPVQEMSCESPNLYPLSTGSYDWKVFAVDQAGNQVWSGVRSFAVTMDDTPPVISLVAPTSGSYYTIDSIPVSATALDIDSGIKKIELYSKIGVNPSVLIDSCVYATPVTTEVTCSRDFVPEKHTEPGIYTIIAVATDDASSEGNPSDKSTEKTGESGFEVVQADLIPPDIQFSVESGVVSGQEFGVAITATDDLAVPLDGAGSFSSVTAHYSFTPPSGSEVDQGSIPCQVNPLDESEYLCSVSISVAAEGTYKFYATAIDVALPTAHTTNEQLSVPVSEAGVPSIEFTQVPPSLVGAAPGSATVVVHASDVFEVSSLAFSYKPPGGSFTPLSCSGFTPGPDVSCIYTFPVNLNGVYDFSASATNNGIPSKTSQVISSFFTADVSLPTFSSVSSTPPNVYFNTPNVVLSALVADSGPSGAVSAIIYFKPAGESSFGSIKPCPTAGVCSVTLSTPLVKGDAKWYVEALDAAGNAANTGERTLSVLTDSTPPSFSVILDPAEPIYSGSSVGLSATAKDSETGINSMKLFYKIGEGSYAQVGTTCSGGAAGVDVTCAQSLSNVVAGHYYVYATATDLDVPTTGTSDTIEFDVTQSDLIDPVITFSQTCGRGSSCEIYSGDEFTVNIFAEDDSGISSLTAFYKINGVSQIDADCSTDLAPAETLYWCEIPISSAVAGSYVFTATAIDSGLPIAQQATESSTVTIGSDVETPTISFVSAPDDESFLTPGTISLSASVSDDVGLTEVSFSIDGPSGAIPVPSCPEIPGDPIPKAFTCNTQFSALANGVYSFYATVTDNNLPEHKTSSTETRSFTIDGTDPILSNTLVLPGGSIYANSLITLSTSSSDGTGSGIELVEIYFKPSGGSAFSVIRECTASGTCESPVLSTPLATGTNYWYVKAIDKVGHVAYVGTEASPLSFNVLTDVTLPVITEFIKSIPPDPVYTNNEVTLRAKASDAQTGINSIAITYSVGASSITLSCTDMNVAAGVEAVCEKSFIASTYGTYSISTVVTNGVGLTNSLSGTSFFVTETDYRYPRFSSINLPSPAPLAGSEFTVIFPVEDDLIDVGDGAGHLASVTVKVTLPGEEEKTNWACDDPQVVLGASSYYCYVTIPLASVGDYRFEVTATDVASPIARSTTTDATVSVTDSGSPSVSLSRDPTTSPLKAGTQVSLSVIASDDVGLDSIFFTITEPNDNVITKTCPTPTYAPDLDVYCESLAAFTITQNGEYTYKVTATDRNSPSAHVTVANGVPIIGDISPPTVTSFQTNPVPPLYYTTSPLELSVVTGDNIGVAAIDLFLRKTTDEWSSTPLLNCGGSSCTSFNIGPKTVGDYEWYERVTDTAGNVLNENPPVSPNVHEFSIEDNVPPTIDSFGLVSLYKQGAGSGNVANDNNDVSVTAQASDAYGIQSISIYYTPPSGPPAQLAGSCASSPCTKSFAITANGDYSFYAEATDNSPQHNVQTTATSTIKGDVTNPAIDSTTVTPSGTIYSGQTDVKLKVTASDANGVYGVMFYYTPNGVSEKQVFIENPTKTSTTFNAELLINPSYVTAGSFSWYAVAYDNTGTIVDYSSSNSFTLTPSQTFNVEAADVTAPSVSLSTSSPLDSDTEIVLQAAAEDVGTVKTGIASITISYSIGGVAQTPVTCLNSLIDPGLGYSCSVNLGKLPAGTQITFSATATDDAYPRPPGPYTGSTQSNSFTVYLYDTNAPSVSLVRVPIGAFVKTSPTLSATAIDNPPGPLGGEISLITFNWLIDGVAQTKQECIYSPPEESASCEMVVPIQDGKLYSFSVTATDNALPSQFTSNPATDLFRADLAAPTATYSVSPTEVYDNTLDAVLTANVLDPGTNPSGLSLIEIYYKAQGELEYSKIQTCSIDGAPSSSSCVSNVLTEAQLVPGTASWYAKATDAVGNVLNPTAPGVPSTFEIIQSDETPPTVAIGITLGFSYAKGLGLDYVTNPHSSGPFALSVTAHDEVGGSGLALIKPYRTAVGGSEELYVDICTTSPCNYFVISSSEGFAYYRAEAFDNNGNIGRAPSSGSYSVFFDSTPPTLTSSSVTPESTIYFGQENVQLHFVSEDLPAANNPNGNGIRRVMLYYTPFGQSEKTVTCFDSPTAVASYTCDYTVPSADLVAGLFSWRAEAWDNTGSYVGTSIIGGNKGSLSTQSFTVYADDQYPTLVAGSLQKIAPFGDIYPSIAVTFQASANDFISGVKTIQLQYSADGSSYINFATSCTFSPVGGTQRDCIGQQFTPTSTGTYYVRAVITDNALYTGAPADLITITDPISITVISRPPALYLGGDFGGEGVFSSRLIGLLDTSTQTVSTLGTGLGRLSTSAYGVKAILKYNNEIYVAGLGLVPPGVSAPGGYGLVKFNPTTGLWSLVISSTIQVYAMAVDGDNNLYIGGAFSSLPGCTNCKYVAKWSPITQIWSPLATGVSATVNAITIDGNNQVYVGGQFATPFSRIARWNPTDNTWYQVGTTTISVNVHSLRFYQGDLYLGLASNIDFGDGNVARYIAKYDPDTNTLGAMGAGTHSGFTGGIVYALTEFKGELYAGGAFTAIYGGSSARVVKYTSANGWVAVGTTGSIPPATITALEVDQQNDVLYVGGLGYTNLAYLSGDSLISPNIGLDGQDGVRALFFDSAISKMYVGGSMMFSRSYVGSAASIEYASNVWSALGAGTSGNVNKVVVDGNGNVYVVGSFTSIGSCNSGCNGIAMWNPSLSTWTSVGGGVDGTQAVRSIIIDASNNVYIGGDFTSVGGVAANYVAKWTVATSSWSYLSTGLNGAGYSLALDNSGVLYAGTDRVLQWTGSSWTQIGGAFSGQLGNTGPVVYSLIFDKNNVLYAGGAFTSPATAIAKWTGSSWVQVYSEQPDNYVLSLAVDANNNIYVGGAFTYIGATTYYNGIAKWNGAAYSKLGNGVNGEVRMLIVDSSNKLYAGGLFTNVGSNIAKWDPLSDGGAGKWSALGQGTNTRVLGLAVDFNNNLYAVGEFTTAGGVSANKIAKYLTTVYVSLSSDNIRGVRALFTDPYGVLYVAGSFNSIGSCSACSKIAKWNGATWSPLGTGIVGTSVFSIAFDSTNNLLYAGGQFTSAGSCTTALGCKNIAKWNMQTQTWSAVSTPGIDYEVYSLAFDSIHGILYAGGSFLNAGSCNTCTYLAKWNGYSWSRLSSGNPNSGINSITFDPIRNYLFFTGSFTLIGTNSYQFVAYYDANTDSWRPLSSGTLASLAYTSFVSDDKVYVGGGFSAITGCPGNNCRYIGVWNISDSKWYALDYGLLGGSVYSIYEYADDIYVGGALGAMAYGYPTGGVVKWNKQALKWTPLPPINGTTYAFASYSGS